MNYFSKNRLITIIVIALMIINVAALVTIAANSRIFKTGDDPKFKKESKSKNGDRKRDFSRFFSEKLQLTPEQQSKMDELWAQNKKRMEPLTSEMNEKRRMLNEAMGKKELDEERIRELNEEMVVLDRDIRNSLLEFNKQIRELLDEDQLDKYLEMHRRIRGGKGYQKRHGQMNLINRF